MKPRDKKKKPGTLCTGNNVQEGLGWVTLTAKKIGAGEEGLTQREIGRPPTMP